MLKKGKVVIIKDKSSYNKSQDPLMLFAMQNLALKAVLLHKIVFFFRNKN